ncbi:MAG TPA: ABC transporter substrate-binding protein [Isoptericola sp.]|nr:ABC transporter substrate-binding protein [Isoptericola sp.]
MGANRGSRRLLAGVAGSAALALTLAACGGGGGNDGGSGGGGGDDSLTIGTTDKITSLDPAMSYDNGSSTVMWQVYGHLMNSKPGSAEVEPDLAESAEFTEPTEYTVKLKPGLKFANGHDLTSSDVKFTFDRQLKIKADNGPWSLLQNLESVDTPDDTTVVFHLKTENDQTFPQVLSSPAGPIVDEEVFSPDEGISDQEIVDGKAFTGQYTISSYKINELVTYEANPEYQGLLGKPKTPKMNVRYFSDASNLKLEIQEGGIDVAWRSLSATDIEDLRGNDAVKVVDGPGGEIRYITFNFETQPYGAKTDDADPKKALAVRQAVADLIDREALADQIYKGTYTPLYSYVPEGLPGATESLKGLYGDGQGGPDADKAKKTLEDAGVTTPIELNLQYSNDHYGPSSGDEYALIKDQLEESGLFTVNLQTTEWVKYSDDRVKNVYPAYQLGWFPDYSDADTYLTPFFLTENFLVNHYSNPEVDKLIKQQVSTPDKGERDALIGKIQDTVAQDLSTLPYLQGAQLAVVGSGVTGAEDTLDASYKFRFGMLAKG